MISNGRSWLSISAPRGNGERRSREREMEPRASSGRASGETCALRLRSEQSSTWASLEHYAPAYSLHLLSTFVYKIAPERCQVLRDRPISRSYSICATTSTQPTTLGDVQQPLQDRDSGKDTIEEATLPEDRGTNQTSSGHSIYSHALMAFTKLRQETL